MNNNFFKDIFNDLIKIAFWGTLLYSCFLSFLLIFTFVFVLNSELEKDNHFVSESFYSIYIILPWLTLNIFFSSFFLKMKNKILFMFIALMGIWGYSVVIFRELKYDLPLWTHSHTYIFITIATVSLLILVVSLELLFIKMSKILNISALIKKK